MSDQIFYFEPDLVEPREYSSTWSTIHTTFDSGTGQWQSEWSRQIYDFKFIYRGYFDDLRWNPIEAFFNAHKGRGDSFLLPSWRAETKLTTAYTSGIDLYLASTIFFSAVTGKPGNLLHIKHINGSHEEVREVREVVNGTHLNLVVLRFPDTQYLRVAEVVSEPLVRLASAFDNAYPVNSVVQVAYRVRFGTDKLPPLKYVGMDIYECELTFQEDI